MLVGVNYEQMVKRIFTFLTLLFSIQKVVHGISKKKYVINGKFLSQEHSRKKNYNRKRGFS